MTPGRVVGGQLGDVGDRSRCHGGSWWWSTAGRPRSTSATTLDAGRFSGIVQQVLDDHEVEAVERGLDLVDARLLGGVDREAGDEAIDRAVAGDRRHGEPDLSEHPLPARRDDRHAISAAETERQDRSGRHG